MADLHLHRVLRAPRSTVWACWTQAEHIPQWFAPAPVVTEVRAFDLRPGGAFQIAMSMDGKPLGDSAPGCFLEVVPEERLTWTSALGPDFRPIADHFASQAPFLFTATITLADHPEGTDYRVVARHKDEASARAHEEMGFSQGWGTVAEQLGAYAAEVAQGLSVTLTRRFKASPAQVYAAWTDPAALSRWYGPEGFSCETREMDLRVGGQWLFDMVGHGMRFPNRHRWTELSPHSRIRYLMDAGEGSGAPAAITVTLEPEGDGTRLSQTLQFPSAEKLAEARGIEFEARAQESLTKLAASLGE